MLLMDHTRCLVKKPICDLSQMSYKSGNTSADLGAKEGMADKEEQVPGSLGTHKSS